MGCPGFSAVRIVQSQAYPIIEIVSLLQLSLSDEIMRRIAEDAKRLHVSPEVMAETALETIYGPPPDELAQEIAADPELEAMLERSAQDIEVGRVHSHERVKEWHRNHPQ
jgi:predicted transcriptional regulator